jgi:hypothetical protein
MRNVLDKSTENHNTFYVQFFFFFENRAVYEIAWKNTVIATEATYDNITGSMNIAWWLTKTTDTHAEYVILIVFSRQQVTQTPRKLHSHQQ